MAARTKAEILAQIMVLEAFIDPVNNAAENEVEFAKKRIEKLKKRLEELTGTPYVDAGDTVAEPRIEVEIHKGMVHVRVKQPKRPVMPGIHLQNSCSVKRNWASPAMAVASIQSFLGIRLTT